MLGLLVLASASSTMKDKEGPMRRPYISITDFTNIAQVEEMQKVFFDCNGTESGRYLGVGVMMSYKTLHNLPSKWTNVFPRKETIKDIFCGGDKTLNVLHYADYEAVDVHCSLEHAIMFGGSYLDCLQLDMIWPDPLILQKIKKNHRSLRLILQIGESALDEIKNNTRKFVTKLSAYEECIDDVLLDKSMGRGLGLKADTLRPFARLIARLFPRMGIVFAGGLGAQIPCNL